MYSLCCYDFNSGENKIFKSGSFDNMLLLCETLILDYIMICQGKSYGTDYKSFLYKYNESPDRSRCMDVGPFYAEIDKYDCNKFVIREKIKVYGWIWNSYSYKNHIELSIVKTGPVNIDTYINTEFRFHDEYDHVLNELFRVDECSSDISLSCTSSEDF